MIRVSGVPYHVEEKDICAEMITNETGKSSSTSLNNTDLTKDQAMEMALDALNEWMKWSAKTDFSPALMKTLEAITAIDSVMGK